MNTTIGIFTTHLDAENALHELRAFGVKDEDISYVYANTSGKLVDSQEGEKIENGTGNGIVTGALLGTALGFSVASGVLIGLGPLLVAGPLATALGFTGVTATTVAGAVTGGAAGGFIGALMALGVSEEDAVLFQKYVEAGDVLISVHEAGIRVRDVLVKAHAKQVWEY